MFVPSSDRLAAQLTFILEIDRLKSVLRQTLLTDGSRRENDAEHSWHIAVMAMLLAEHAAEPVDVRRVVEMLLIHDIVEIDAGDAFIYDEAAQAAKAALEDRAATRIFGLLPADQAERLRAVWDEFEARATADARFAHALDRLQPILHNFATEGGTWKPNHVTADKVVRLNGKIDEGAPILGDYVQALVEEAVRRGYLPAG